MTLTWIAAAKAYKIISVTNTTYYKPDLRLMEKDAATLAGMEGQIRQGAASNGDRQDVFGYSKSGMSLG
jgi:hypothetical protein